MEQEKSHRNYVIRKFMELAADGNVEEHADLVGGRGKSWIKIKFTGFGVLKYLKPKQKDVSSQYFVRHDPAGTGRKWLVRYDGKPIADEENISVERFEKAVEANSNN